MIISHKYKFIFIKTRKTAGSSIETDLNKILGPNDIATPVWPRPKVHTPKNFKRGFFQKNFREHMPASEIKEYIGGKIFDEYFKFCIEREPVDKCLSFYNMKKSRSEKFGYLFKRSNNGFRRNMSFEDCMYKKIIPNDVEKYTSSEGELLVDEILKYEELPYNIIDISQRLGFNFSLKSKEKVGNYEKDFVSESLREKIYGYFEDSLRFTNYSKYKN
tara:strand:- start:12689 stop:13339 length:651 start_codon:yes stop_codon:yes gene_type:complete